MMIIKYHNFMSCFSSKELKMPALKYVSKYPTNCALERNEDPQRSWENDFRLEGSNLSSVFISDPGKIANLS